MKDPVCGMDVKPEKAAAKTDSNGQTFYFCSTSCKQKFDQNPQTYTASKSSQSPQAQRT